MKYCLGYSLIIIIAFVSGCKQNPSNPQSGGTVSGIVKLYSDTGLALPNSGVLVSMSGSTQTAQTNDTGFWQMTGVPEGTYTFSFTKQGFGAMKVFGVQVKGRDTVAEVDMAEPATEEVNFATLSIGLKTQDSTAFYFIQGGLQPPFIRIRSLALCISPDSAALANDPSSASLILPYTTDPAMTGYAGEFYWNSTNTVILHQVAFKHGTKVFAALCVFGEGPKGSNFSNYYDLDLGKQVYTSLGPHAQIMSGVIP